MKTYPTCSRPPDHRVRFFASVSRFVAAALLTASASQIHAATIYGVTADRQVDSSGSLADSGTMMSGYSGTTGYNPVVVFQLPTLPAGKEFSAASLRFYFGPKTGTPPFSGDLYGIGVSSSSAVSSGDFYNGASDPSSILIQDNFVVSSGGAGAHITSAAVLTDYLNAVYANGAGAGQYVFFRVSPDVAGLNSFTRYNLYSAEYSGGSFYWPSITYSTADSGWLTVPLGGGGFVTGLISDSTGADIYCRTDVGGAFKWLASAGQWVSITDKIVPTSTPGASRLMNTASIALDPSNANNLYVAVGGGIYASTDKGNTWSAINTTVVVEGNNGYRSLGERLAVDPNNSNIVWYGSNNAGLLKGTKSGGTWTWTTVPSASVPFGDAGGGVTFVACDKNGSSTIVYAGSHVASGVGGGVYRSTDGGSTWALVTGVTIAQPYRGQVSANGNLYVTGPGVVARLVRAGTGFTNVTPLAGVTYRGVAIDPNDATGNTLFVAEAGNRLWRTTSGGTSWLAQGTNFNNNGAITRQEPDGTPTLTGYWFGNTSSLLVNPANSNELWAGDFFGVARTQNANLMGNTAVGNQPVWYMLQKGQEETVVETVKTAPTGAALMAGVADVGGFRYNDLDSRPYGSGGNGFNGANSTSLDFSESNNLAWAAGWYNTGASGGGGGTGSYSNDGGASWYWFGELARKTINSGTGAWETWDLTTFLAAQKAKGVSTVTLVLATGRATNYATTPLLFDSREAADPTFMPKLVLNGSSTVNPTADTFVYGGSTTTNYGNSTTLALSHTYAAMTNTIRQITLKFDLTSVSSITSASLQLHRVTASAGLAYSVSVYGSANTSWVEGDGGTDNLPANEATWNNRPKPYASSSGNPQADPRYMTAAGVSLAGGRVAVSSTNPDIMVWMPFGISTVPHYTNDHGATWTPCVGLPANINRLAGKSNPSYVIQQLTSDRSNGYFYIAQLSSGGGGHTVWRSTDGGANWAPQGNIGATTYNVYRTQIVAAPAANDVWFCDDGVSDPTKGGLWRSSGGGSWVQVVGTSSIKSVRQVSFGKAASGSGYTVFINGYVGGVQGVYRSDNYGANWTRLLDVPTVCSIESLAGDRQVYGRAFIGTGGRGIFRSQ